MCDRGRLQDAVKLIWLQTGVSIQLRFCTIHILRNLERNFGFSGSEFENAIWKLQPAYTEVDYKAALTTIRTTLGNDVSTYIEDIHPITWTVFAKMPMQSGDATAGLSNDTNSSLNLNTSMRNPENNNPPMLPCPLFGWRTTNFVESNNNTILVNGMRNATPLEALKNPAKAAMNKFSMRQDQLEKWTAQHLTVTPHA